MSWLSGIEADFESDRLGLLAGLRIISPTSQGLRTNSAPASRVSGMQSSSANRTRARFLPNTILTSTNHSDSMILESRLIGANQRNC